MDLFCNQDYKWFPGSDSNRLHAVSVVTFTPKHSITRGKCGAAVWVWEDFDKDNIPYCKKCLRAI